MKISRLVCSILDHDAFDLCSRGKPHVDSSTPRNMEFIAKQHVVTPAAFDLPG